MNAEIRPTVLLVPQEDAIAELRDRLPIIPAQYTPEASDSAIAYAGVTRLSGGLLYTSLAGLAPLEGKLVDRAVNSDAQEIFEAAAAALRQNDFFYEQLLEKDGYWWQNTSLEKLHITDSLIEVWHTTTETEEAPRTFEILNCSTEPLDEAEQTAFRETLKDVSNLTSGKIYDRMKGIVLCGDGFLEDGSVALFSPHTGILLVNMDEVRRFKDVVPNRYKQYFDTSDGLLALKVLVAHELGHAMDIRSVEEARRHGIDPLARAYMIQGERLFGCSAFDEFPGWDSKEYQGTLSTLNKWYFNDAAAIEIGEYPANEYAATEPGEDAAETFAITALKGKTLTLQRRQLAIMRMIELADGRTLPAHGLELNRVAKPGELYTPVHRRLARICLNACLFELPKEG